jgi:hypothetical protein
MKKLMSSMMLALTLLLGFSLANVVPAQAATPEAVEASIVKGLAWLASQQQPDGRWQFYQGSNYPGEDVSTTAMAVLKFEDRARELSLDPFDSVQYPYATNVINGLNYLFSNVVVYGKDSNNNETYYFNEGSPIYSTGYGMMPIAASTKPDRVIVLPGKALDGKTYRQALQGLVYFLAQVQNTTGGWRYSVPSSDVDNSFTGTATLGIGYAHAAPPFGFSLDIPPSVLTGLTNFVTIIQTTSGPYSGGSTYCPYCGWENIYKTGNLLFELAQLGAGPDDPRTANALGFIGKYWNTVNNPYGQGGGWMGDYLATFTMMKGLMAYGLNDVPGHPNWFDDVSNYVVKDQHSDGSWTGQSGYATSPTFSTASALLVLEKAVPIIIGLVPDAGGPYYGFNTIPITFSAANSKAYNDTIVLYEWDWDNNGVYQKTTSPIITHAFATTANHTVKLRITGKSGKTATTTTKAYTIKYASSIGSGTVNVGNVGDFFRTSVKVAYNPTTPVTGKLEYYIKNGPSFISTKITGFIPGSGANGKELTFTGEGVYNSKPCKFTYKSTEKNAADILITDVAGNTLFKKTIPATSVSGFTQILIL